MEWVIGLGLIIVVWLAIRKRKPIPEEPNLSMLPECFVVYDLETTGLSADRHQIIEIGAIRVNRDSDEHQTFQTLVKPKGRVPKKITQITGITNEMIDEEAIPLDEALKAFRDFAGQVPLVAFNAQFDNSFLKAACASTGSKCFTNESYCSLKMARRAWPDRSSYRLADLAKDGNLSGDDTHRALGDCRRTMIVYAAAAQILRSHK